LAKGFTYPTTEWIKDALEGMLRPGWYSIITSQTEAYSSRYGNEIATVSGRTVSQPSQLEKREEMK
jgi:hypothetical protein